MGFVQKIWRLQCGQSLYFLRQLSSIQRKEFSQRSNNSFGKYVFGFHSMKSLTISISESGLFFVVISGDEDLIMSCNTGFEFWASADDNIHIAAYSPILYDCPIWLIQIFKGYTKIITIIKNILHFLINKTIINRERFNIKESFLLNLICSPLNHIRILILRLLLIFRDGKFFDTLNIVLYF